jgi:hypothetical protein
MIEYARTDVHYLLFLADVLGAELEKLDQPSLRPSVHSSGRHPGVEPGTQPRSVRSRASSKSSGGSGGSRASSKSSGGSGGSTSAPLMAAELSGVRTEEAAEVAGVRGDGTMGGRSTPIPLPPSPYPAHPPPAPLLKHVVEQSQALTLNIYRPTTRHAAAESAALGLLRAAAKQAQQGPQWLAEVGEGEGEGEGGMHDVQSSLQLA